MEKARIVNSHGTATMPYDDYDDDDLSDLRRPRRRSSSHPGPLPHSWAGGISVVISCLMFFGFAGIFGFAILLAARGQQPGPNDPVLVAIGFAVITCLMVTFGGLVLGLAACFQSDRSIVLGILGGTFNGFLLLGIGVLMCMGMVLGQ